MEEPCVYISNNRFSFVGCGPWGTSSAALKQKKANEFFSFAFLVKE
jgi:hypothetical protein